jgi:hypothetical protein
METKKIPEPKRSLIDFEYVAFTVEREAWNKYKLDDKAILKTKFILINVFAERDHLLKLKKAKEEKGKAGFAFKIQSSTVMGVEVPLSMLGEPGKEGYTFQDLESSVVKKDIDFETISETWNVYELATEIEMKVRNSPVRIGKTSKFDSHGVPIYLVDFSADIKTSPKT